MISLCKKRCPFRPLGYGKLKARKGLVDGSQLSRISTGEAIRKWAQNKKHQNDLLVSSRVGSCMQILINPTSGNMLTQEIYGNLLVVKPCEAINAKLGEISWTKRIANIPVPYWLCGTCFCPL